MNLNEFFCRLDACPAAPRLPDLQRWLNELTASRDDFGDGWLFAETRYQRNLLRRTETYEALLLCFAAGQRTPIHDHAGSACGVKVIRGTAIETLFRPTADGWLYATGSSELTEGGVAGSVDMDIHQLSNLQTGDRQLATLHIYSPPLRQVGNYSILDNSKKVVFPVCREALLPVSASSQR